MFSRQTLHHRADWSVGLKKWILNIGLFTVPSNDIQGFHSGEN